MARLVSRFHREYAVGVRKGLDWPAPHKGGLSMRPVLRLASVVSFALLFGSVSLAAQNIGASQNAGVAHVGPIQANDLSIATAARASCPVSLRAQRRADGSIRKVDKNRPEGVAQLLRLIITSSDSRQIVEARLRVRGTSGKGRLDRSASTPGGVDATRNLTVRFKPGADNEVSADVWVPGMTAVLQVDLSAVTFADGGTQMFGAADGCRFTPDLLMLIAEKDGH
jgi:hypothetical protein